VTSPVELSLWSRTKRRLRILVVETLWRLRAVRRLGTTWELPSLSILLVAGAVGFFLRMSRSDWGAGWWLCVLAAALVGLYLGASRFSGITVGLAGAACVVSGTLALGHLGIVSTQSAHGRDTRSGATALLAQLQSVEPAGSTVDANPATGAIWLLCSAGSGRFEGTPPTCQAATPAQARAQANAAVALIGAAAPAAPTSAQIPTDDPRRLDLLRADAVLAIARYQLAVAASGDQAAAQSNVTKLEAADRAALAATLEPPASLPVISAVTKGANEVASSLPGSSDVPIELELAGWVVLAVLALALIRLLSTRNATYSLGPVSMDPPKGTDGAKDGSSPSVALAEVETFRTYLLQNLPEPGAIPGGRTAAAMTDIAGAVDVPGVPIAAFVKAIVTAINVPSGYSVEYRDIANLTADEAAPATGSDPAGAEESAIAVRIRAVGSDRLLDQTTHRGTDRDALLRQGAYWAAARIIQSSRSVPPWARWDAATSQALARYFLDTDGAKGDLASLREAANLAPTSGLLALELSQREAIAGDLVGSLLHALQAATLYPRYINARYRLAVSAGMLAAADHPLTASGAGTYEEKAALRDALTRYGEATGHNHVAVQELRACLEALLVAAPAAPVAEDGGAPSAAEVDLPYVLCRLAEAELDDCRRLTWWPRIAINALRSDERRFWWLLLWGWQQRKDRQLIAKSSRLVVAARSARRVKSYQVFERLYARVLRGLYYRKSNPATAARPADAETVAQLRSDAVFARAFHYERLAAQMGQNWQFSYNLACFWSVVSDRLSEPSGDALAERAIALLELAVQSRNSFQLTQEWITVDPDLRNLRGNARFQALVRALPKEGS
jgi:hypothetical protein